MSFSIVTSGLQMPVVSVSPPISLFMGLQGQVAPNTTPSPPSPSSPNVTGIYWPTVPGAVYNIYRNAVQIAANWPAPPYLDQTAALSVNGVAGSSPPYYLGSRWIYTVTSVINGVESAPSPTQGFLVYDKGQGPSVAGAGGWGGDFSFPNPGINCFVDYNNTVGDPNGCVSFSFNSAFAGFQPYMGNNATLWNMNARAFTKLQFDLKPTIVNQSWQLNPLRVGDVPIYNTSGGQTAIPINGNLGPTPTSGQWDTYVCPLALMLNDFGPSGLGPPVFQPSVYKWAIQDTTGNATGLWYVRRVFYLP